MTSKSQATSASPLPPTAKKTTRYIALLRAINVGGHTVKMDLLRSLFEQLGFTHVETFIASGNVIFDAPHEQTLELEEQIEAHLYESLGYKVATFIRSIEDIARVANHEPFPDGERADTSSLYIAFLPTPPGEPERQKLMAMRNPVDDFHVDGREIYWLCRTRSSDSIFSGGLLEKTIGLPATVRNVTTIKKLAAKYGKSETQERKN